MILDRIKEYAGFIFCSIKGHTLSKAGSCPFTGMSYDYCKRCNRMIPIEEID
jgi:hypothetical protein